MGTEFELFKPKKNERFDLGKSAWTMVFSPIKQGSKFKMEHLFRHEQELYWRILENIAFQFDESLPLSFFKDLAFKIYNWCGKDYVELYEYSLFNELHWTDKTKSAKEIEEKFPYTGSRYIQEKCPDKKTFTIEVGSMTKDEVNQLIREMQEKFRKVKIYGN